MKKHKLALIILILLQLTSCQGSPAETTSPAGNTPAPTATEAAVPAGPTTTPTVAETAVPAVILAPVQPLAPDSFSNATVLHELWPDVQEAAQLYAALPFGLSITNWALSEDGRYAAVAGCDAQAGDILISYNLTLCEMTELETESHAYFFIFDAESGELIATLPETGEILTVTYMRFTHAGSKLVYEIYGQGLKVWDIESAQVEATLSDPTLTGFDISPDDKWLAVSFDEGPPRIWDLRQHDYAEDVPMDGPVQFSPDGSRVLAYEYPYLTVYETGTWRKLSQRALMPDGSFESYQLSSDFSLMAVCATGVDDQPVMVWDVATAALLQTLTAKFGKCGNVYFSPDRKYLLFFNNHGAGPLVWSVDGWHYARGSQTSTNFVGATDEFVHRIEFSRDQSKLLVATFARLTLYSLPAAEASAQPTVSEPTPTAAAVAAGLVEPPPMSCDLTVSVALDLEAEMCGPNSYSHGGNKDSGRVSIELRDDDFTAVIFILPPWLSKNLQPGTYEIWDASDLDAGRIVAEFNYYSADDNSIDSYYSYAGTGDVVFTVTGEFVSGSYTFGAHSIDGKQVIVNGTFTNIPFVYTDRP